MADGLGNEVAAGGEPAAASPSAIQRRTLLKTAVATGAAAAVWTAPNIETLGFAPAAAATACNILTPPTTNSNNGQSDTVAGSPLALCNLNVGNNGQAESFTVTNPGPNCASLTIVADLVDCSGAKNPDVGQLAFHFVNPSAGCAADCTILSAVFTRSNGELLTEVCATTAGLTAGCAGVPSARQTRFPCPTMTPPSDLRFAVRLECSPTPCPDNPNSPCF